jgi:hypothetical protein
MALFSGGRFIRASLQRAGSGFWANTATRARHPSESHSDASEDESAEQASINTSSKSSRNRPETGYGLQLFGFDGERDGEDIKLEFKKRIEDIEILLTIEEKEDIIQESQLLFDFMIAIVLDLDKTVEGVDYSLGAL